MPDTRKILPQPEVVPREVPRHSLVDDVVALASASMLVALGVAYFERAGLMTGGTAGLALLLSYRFGVSFGSAFLLINVPFLAPGRDSDGASRCARWWPSCWYLQLPKPSARCSFPERRTRRTRRFSVGCWSASGC